MDVDFIDMMSSNQRSPEDAAVLVQTGFFAFAQRKAVGGHGAPRTWAGGPKGMATRCLGGSNLQKAIQHVQKIQNDF